ERAGEVEQIDRQAEDQRRHKIGAAGVQHAPQLVGLGFYLHLQIAGTPRPFITAASRRARCETGPDLARSAASSRRIDGYNTSFGTALNKRKSNGLQYIFRLVVKAPEATSPALQPSAAAFTALVSAPSGSTGVALLARSQAQIGTRLLTDYCRPD